MKNFWCLSPGCDFRACSGYRCKASFKWTGTVTGMAVWTEKGGRGWPRRGQCRGGEGRPSCYSLTVPLPRAECELWPSHVSHSCTWATLLPYHHLFTLLCLHHAVSKPPSVYHLCPLCSCPRVHGRRSGNVCCGKVSLWLQSAILCTGQLNCSVTLSTFRCQIPLFPLNDTS